MKISEIIINIILTPITFAVGLLLGIIGGLSTAVFLMFYAPFRLTYLLWENKDEVQEVQEDC